MGAARVSLASWAKRVFAFSDEPHGSQPGPDDDFWYQPITPHGQLSYRDALQIAAASAAGRAISETLGSLPLHLYRRRPGGGKELARDHRLFQTLSVQPHDHYTAVEMWEQCIQSLLFRGNWLATYEVDARLNVVRLNPIPWERVTVDIDRDSGIKTFQWNTDNGKKVTKPDSEVLHIPGNAYDGVRGYGLLSTASEALGVSRRVSTYIENHFANRLPPIAVSFATPIQPKARDEWFHFIKKTFIGGRAPFMVLDNGGKIEHINMKASDLQLVEIMDLATRQIARIFRVPPHVIGDLKQATFSNIEHQGQDFVTMSLMPWARRIESRLEAVLLGIRERTQYSIRFNFDALLRGDSAARGEYYSKLFQTGGITANEIRDHEGRNPVEGGDVPMIQGALIPLTRAGEHLNQQEARNAA